MPGTSSRRSRINRRFNRTTPFRNYNYYSNYLHYGNHRNNVNHVDKTCDMICNIFLITTIITMIGTIYCNITTIENNKLIFVNKYIKYDANDTTLYSSNKTCNQEYYKNNCNLDFSNKTCNLEYIDMCDINSNPDMKGIQKCKFKHFIDFSKRKSQDEDGIWEHYKCVIKNDSLTLILKRISNYNEIIVGIDLNFTINHNSRLIDVYGIYDVHNGYSNKIWGNCSDINVHN